MEIDRGRNNEKTPTIMLDFEFLKGEKGSQKDHKFQKIGTKK